jgi:hypothetical protein
MAIDRRRQVMLGAAAAVVLIGGYWTFFRTTSAAPRSTSNPRGQTPGRRNLPAAIEAPDVHIEALNEERPDPAEAGRNLFRFKPKPPPPPPPRPVMPPSPPPVNPGPVGPPPPPALPQIPLKFIGTMSQGGKTLAVLSDGIGPPQYGYEGSVILGRYKILHIGVESVELSYADGRGRQTIRLSGG